MSIFENLEAQAIEENLPFKNAAVVAIDRCERRFGTFVSSAKGEKEFNARLDLIRDDIEKIAEAVCEEHGYNDPQHIAKLVVGQIELLAETQKLPTQNPEGYYTDPSPKLNPGSAGDNMKNTNPAIAELTPDESQHPSDKAWPWDGDIPREGEGLEQVDADKPMQPEFTAGPPTQTFPDKGQANPVDKAANIKEAASRMDFNSLSEIMTPSEAVKELVEAGMPQHEAKDRIDFYVNHVDPGWSQKQWTSAIEDEMPLDETPLDEEPVMDEAPADEDEQLGEMLSDLFDADDEGAAIEDEEDFDMAPERDAIGLDTIDEGEEPNPDELDSIEPVAEDDVLEDPEFRSSSTIGQEVFQSFVRKANKKK